MKIQIKRIVIIIKKIRNGKLQWILHDLKSGDKSRRGEHTGDEESDHGRCGALGTLGTH
jgi:hypothetical protein